MKSIYFYIDSLAETIVKGCSNPVVDYRVATFLSMSALTTPIAIGYAFYVAFVAPESWLLSSLCSVLTWFSAIFLLSFLVYEDMYRR